LHRPDGEVVYIKVDQIVLVMSAKDTGAAERARSKGAAAERSLRCARER
jgi:hypothetical protein